MTTPRKHRHSTEEMATWSAQQFSRWLAEGAAVVADDPLGSGWVMSFPPLRLDVSQDPADQVIGHLCKLADKSELAYQRAIAGVGIALDHIGVVSSPRFVEFLLKIAAAMDPPGYVEAVLRHLKRHSVRSHHDRWDRVVSVLVHSSANIGRPQELLSLLDRLQGTVWANQNYRYLYLIKAVEHDFERWAELKYSYGVFIEQLRSEHPQDYRNLIVAVNDGLRRERKPRLMSVAATYSASTAVAIEVELPSEDEQAVVDFEVSYAAFSELKSPQLALAEIVAITKTRETS